MFFLIQSENQKVFYLQNILITNSSNENSIENSKSTFYRESQLKRGTSLKINISHHNKSPIKFLNNYYSKRTMQYDSDKPILQSQTI